MHVERVKYVIWSADMDRAVKFWCDTFDGRMLKQNSVIAEVEIAGAVIGIHSGGEGKRTWTGISLQASPCPDPSPRFGPRQAAAADKPPSPPASFDRLQRPALGFGDCGEEEGRGHSAGESTLSGNGLRGPGDRSTRLMSRSRTRIGLRTCHGPGYPSSTQHRSPLLIIVTLKAVIHDGKVEFEEPANL